MRAGCFLGVQLISTLNIFPLSRKIDEALRQLIRRTGASFATKSEEDF